MQEVLIIAKRLIDIWPTLNMENIHEEAEHKCWPLIDSLEWTNTPDVFTFNAALFYEETIKEQTPANLINGGLFNEWRTALTSSRFTAYSEKVEGIKERVRQALSHPLATSVDPFWLVFPNNLNLNTWNVDDIAVLMALSPYSATIQSYKPFGPLLYIHGHPEQWIEAPQQDAINQAVQGLRYLHHSLKAIGIAEYTKGTFQ